MKTILLTISVILALLVETQIYSQSVVQNPSVSTPSLPLLVATESEVRQFFDEYVERYTRMDLEEFLLLFSVKARQNQTDSLPEIRTIYSDLFSRSQSLQISFQEMKTEIYQNAVETKARYSVTQVLKKGGEKRAWKGDVRWVLAKEEGKLKILSMDYRYSTPPTVVPEGGSKAKEEPAKRAAVKPEIAARPEEKGPRFPPPLAKEEEVKQFFSSYIDQYHRRDIDGFLSFFSPRAIQNQQDGFKGIRSIYTKFFDQSRDLRYRMEGMKTEIYQNAVDVKARFRVDQTLRKDGEEKVWTGTIRWVLVKEDGALRILSLDYQHDKAPPKKEKSETGKE